LSGEVGATVGWRERAAPAGAGLGAGALLAASLPPWGWWPLAPAGAAVLVAALGGRPWARRLTAGFAGGVGLYGPGLWWMTEFSAPGYVAAVVVEAAILGLAAALVPPRRGRLLAFPAALVAAEAVRGHWPLGGLPLAGIALGQAAGPLGPAARLGGHLLLVALVAGAGAAVTGVARWARHRHEEGTAGEGRRAPLGPVAGLAAVVAVAAAGAAAPLPEAAGTVAVAAVQGGGVRGLRAVFADPRVPFRAQVEASAGVGPVDLVVWPEDVVDVEGPLAGSPEEATVADVARRLGATLVAGVVEDAGPGRFRNAAVVWSPDGRMVDRYDKVHRVPFGEYVPLRGLVRHLADLSAVPHDAIPGRGPGVLRTPAGPLGVLVSYEVFFAERARAATRAGGRVLLVPTNASSYTTAQVPTQELAAARLRALETGRAVVQAAPTGFSAVVDADGRMRARSALGDRAVVEQVVTLRRGQTLATRLGDLPLVALAALILVGVQGKVSGIAISFLLNRRGLG
jgi:apolipoprotein N-acyltransferase